VNERVADEYAARHGGASEEAQSDSQRERGKGVAPKQPEEPLRLSACVRDAVVEPRVDDVLYEGRHKKSEQASAGDADEEYCQVRHW